MSACHICQTFGSNKSLTCAACVKRNISKWTELIDAKERAKADLLEANRELWMKREDDEEVKAKIGEDEESCQIAKREIKGLEREIAVLSRQMEQTRLDISNNNARSTDLLGTREELKSWLISMELLQGGGVTGPRSNEKADTKSRTEDSRQEALVKCKKMLIRDLINIFKLRKVRLKPSPATPSTIPGSPPPPPTSAADAASLNYRVISVGPPPQNLFNSSSLSHLQVKKLNAFLFYSAHLTLLLSSYLGVHLPFPIYVKAGKLWIRFEHMPGARSHPPTPSTSGSPSLIPEFVTTGLKPLFMELDSSNSENLLQGFATLNYNVSCLCKSQGVLIPLSQTHQTLSMLASLCGSPSLGRDEDILAKAATAHYSLPTAPTPSSTVSISAIDAIEYDLDDVVQVHVDEFATKPWEIVDASDDDDVDRGPQADISQNNGPDEWNFVDDPTSLV